MFQFSKEGKAFSSEILKSNLQEIIKLNPNLVTYSEEEDEISLSDHVYIPIDKRVGLIQKHKDILRKNFTN